MRPTADGPPIVPSGGGAACMGGNRTRACGTGHATRPVPRKARTPDNARCEEFFDGDERAARSRSTRGGQVASSSGTGAGRCLGARDGKRPGGAEWNAAQRPENVQNHGGVGDETSFKAIRPPPSGSKLSFGAVLTTPVAAKRVSVQSACLCWRTLSTTPKLVFQPKRLPLDTTGRLPPTTGPRQRGHCNERTRNSHHNTSLSEEGSSRPRSLAARSNKSTKGDRQTSPTPCRTRR